MQNSIKKYCSILVKRAIGVQNGNSAKAKIFETYKELTFKPERQKEIKQNFTKMLNKGDYFRVALATTYGQPVTNRSRDITLKMKSIPVRAKLRENENSRPGEQMLTLEVSGVEIPVTFQLFDCILSIDEGMNEGVVT